MDIFSTEVLRVSGPFLTLLCTCAFLLTLLCLAFLLISRIFSMTCVKVGVTWLRTHLVCESSLSPMLRWVIVFPFCP